MRENSKDNRIENRKDYKNEAQGMSFAALSAICYGSGPIFVDLYYLTGGTPYMSVFSGAVISFILITLAVLVKKVPLRLPVKTIALLMAAGTLNMGLCNALQAISFVYLDAGVATTLHYMYPIFTALLSAIVFKEKLPLYKWITLIIASFSVSCFVSFGNTEGNLLGIVTAITSGMVYAIFIVMMDKMNLSKEDPLALLFYGSMGTVIFSFFCVLMFENGYFHETPKGIAIKVLGAIVITFVANILFHQGVKRIGGVSAAFFSLFEPISSCVLGAIILGEALSARSVLGIVLILSAVLVMTYLDTKRIKKESGS